MKQNAKICAIGEQNVIKVFILEELIRRERKDGGERIEKGREREDRELEIERNETLGN